MDLGHSLVLYPNRRCNHRNHDRRLFLKHIKIENEEYLRVYRTAPPVAYIIGPLFAFFVFLLFPLLILSI